MSRDGPEAVFYEGIDCSADFLHLARKNILEACPTMRPGNLGTVCALYMDGLQEACRRSAVQHLCS